MKPNWKNRTLFYGDNLDFLRGMNNNTVHLIATDPPFNKGRDFHATPDSLASGASFQDRWSWERDVHEQWTDKIKDDYPRLMEAIESARYAHSDGMGAFMCFMAVRLIEMQRVLRDDGSIYLHCDPTASHYLKAVMDAVFGKDCFRNEIVWCYKTGGASKRHFAKKHDILLFYSKSKKYTFNKCLEKSYMGVGYNTGNKNVTLFEDEKSLRYGPYTLVNTKDWWEIPMIATSNKTERVGYPTQKPIKLYERIIEASSNEDDVVLDPFAGCATTLIAAERLGRQWVGIDIWKEAKSVILKRMAQERLIEKEKTGGFPTDLFTEEIQFTDRIPIRTDGNIDVVPFLRVREVVREPKEEYTTNAQKRAFLLKQHGCVCQGCNRTFDDDRYLELDHNLPRADGGWNHISNRILLCGPCNKLKSHVYTLSGLKRENKKRGYSK